MKPGHNVTK